MPRILVKTGFYLLAIFITSLLLTGAVTIPRVQAAGLIRGPHTDNMVIDINPAGSTSEFLKLKSGAIDMADFSLDGSQIADVLGTDGSAPDTDIGLLSFANSIMFQVDLNNGCEATWGPVDAVWLGNSVFNTTILGGLGKTTFDAGAPRYCGYTINAGANGVFGTRLNQAAGADDFLTPVAGYEGFIRHVPDRSEFPAGTFTPISPWTMSVTFRRALATLRNNVIDNIVSTVTLAVKLNNPVPANFVGTTADLLDTSLNFARWTGGRAAANTLLNSLGLSCPGGAVTCTIRADPVDNRCGGNMCALIFYIRADDARRTILGNLFSDELNAVGIPVDRRIVPRVNVRNEAFRQFEYSMATGGWIFLFDKDLHYDLYTDTTILASPTSTSLNYPLNTDAFYKNCGSATGKITDCAAGGKFGSPTPGSETDATLAYRNTQARHAELAVTLPIYGDLSTNAVRKPLWVGTNQNNPAATRGIINRNAIGQMDFFSWFNAYKCVDPLVAGCASAPYGGNFKVGFESDVTDINPVTSEFVWEAYILSTLYDTLLARDLQQVDVFRAWAGACTVLSFSQTCFDKTTWSGTTPHGATGSGSLVKARIQPGADKLFNTDDDIRFQPHPALTLPGPDNLYGTPDDVPVAATTGNCSPSGLFCGKRLTGEDVEASIYYLRDHAGFSAFLVFDVVDVVVKDTPGLPAGNHLDVDVYYGITTYLAEHWVGTVTLLSSDIWGINGTPGATDCNGDGIVDPLLEAGCDDPIPNPFQFSTVDPNQDGNRADHVLYGTGAWKWSTGFDFGVGGVLPANRGYFTGARTPVDFDITGTLDASVGTDKITGVTADDAAAAVAQFQFGLAYNVQRDVNYDKRTDIDDYLAVLGYFGSGSVALSDGIPYGGTSDATNFRAWPSIGPG